MPLVAETDRMAPALADALASRELLAFVTHYPPLEEIVGGTQVRPYELFHAMAAMGHPVRVCEIRASEPSTVRAENLAVTTLRFPANGLVRETLLLPAMFRVLRREARRARREGKALWLYQQVPSGVFLKGGLLPVFNNPAFFLFPAARKLGLPIWAAVHDLSPDHQMDSLLQEQRFARLNPALPAPREAIYRRMGRYSEREQRFGVRRASFITVVSEQMRRALIERYRIPEERIAVFRSGINPALVTDLPPWSPPADGCWRIGFLGSATDVNLTSLLDALAMLPARIAPARVRLVLSGRGTEKAAAQRLAAAGVEITEVPGIRYKDFARFAALVDLWVNPLGEERYFHMTWPLKVPMNLASGRPLVTTETPEVTSSGVKPFVFPAGTSAESLAEAIAAVIGNSERARERAAAGRRFSLEKLAWPRIIERVARQWLAQAGAAAGK
jgi:glycosyltransferase involved in cell wall biosynthesis